MTVYVDPLVHYGWIMYGENVKSCHMIADTEKELVEFGKSIGLKEDWLQPKSFTHFDLVESKRKKAIEAGAVDLPIGDFVKKIVELRAALKLGKYL